MSKSYVIKYCKPDGMGGFINVTPDIATVFRVFVAGTGFTEHVKDFFPLSEANKWISEHTGLSYESLF